MGVTSRKIAIPVCPGRGDLATYKDWRFKLQGEVCTYPVRNKKLKEKIQFFDQIHDDTISHEKLYADCAPEFEDIDMELFSGLIKSFDTSS